MRTYPNPSGSFVFDVFFADGPELMPEKKNGGDDQTDSETDQEKPAVGGKRDEKSTTTVATATIRPVTPLEGCFGLWAESWIPYQQPC